ncbi:MAG TPA: class I SAM-dependent methyltransferase [Mycobacteriales bacterium]|nr:class I SAM-dependent methyltransferase [Mycobacteriales bacterium]
MTTDVRDAYDASAQAWSHGPEEVFAAMAEALVARAPTSIAGARAVDLGTGSGVVARALGRAGAVVTVLDDALGMLALARMRTGGGAAIGDVRALPLRNASVDVASAGFVLNHLDRPADALREMARAVRPGGTVLASTWARGEEHPVKDAAEQALHRRGWARPEWYARLKSLTTPLTDTAEGLHAAADEAGLADADVQVVRVDIDALPVDAMIAWRTNLPPSASFVAALDDDERAALVDEIRAALGAEVPPLRLQMVALSSRVAA